DPQPDSVPINALVSVEGTPLAGRRFVDTVEFVRTIAVARILMPRAMVRLSAGRANMNDETQALCYLAGANSIFLGEKLLTTGNPEIEEDMNLLRRLGLHPLHPDEARRVHRGEISPSSASPAPWPDPAEFAAATKGGSCGEGGCGCG
ncbi:MAG: hypothetical protein ACKOY8_00525, partial [Verrucomicrobiota bacterium]